tara:strand:+ start:353 stop:790 length:438 start_codon:yes stop_codon:yes gene_type:complete
MAEKVIEYSIGLNDKIGYFGLLNKSIITEKNNSDSYITFGGLGLIGGIGYGKTYYFSKGSTLSPYVSMTGFGYYVLAIGAIGSAGISTVLGLDLTAIKWKNKKIIIQFGVISMYDIIRSQNLTLGADNGPSFLMPSFNIQFNYTK